MDTKIVVCCLEWVRPVYVWRRILHLCLVAVYCMTKVGSVCVIFQGEDPLDGKLDNDDINSVAGLLKLYFRELKEPLFPTSLFDQLVACSQRFNINGSSSVLSV